MWAGFSSTSPDMKDTKAFLSKKKKNPEENEVEEGNSGGTLTGETPRRAKRKEKLCKGNTLYHRRSVGTTTSSPIRFTQCEEEEVLLEGPERGV